MNSTDRERMGRLYGATTKWPWPNRSRTLTGNDVSEFFFLMDEIQKQTLAAIMAISRSDDPSQEPDVELDELEAILNKK